MRTEDYLDYINGHLVERELLEQLAEKAAELSQAALKTCRTLEDSHNPAQMGEDEVWEHLDEEMVDMLNAYCAVYGDFSAAANALLDCHGSPKWERWYERVKEAQQK